MLVFIKSLFNIFSHPQNKGKLIETILRLVWWKSNQLLFKYPSIVSLTPEIKCVCYPDSSYGSQIVYTLYPEYFELKFLNYFLKTDSIMFDVGAGFGEYSLLATANIKKGKIYSFEPIKRELERFRENIRINSLNEIISINNLVVSQRNGNINFLVNKIAELSHITKKKTNNSLSIKSISLDNFSKKNDIKFIDLIKIDVEGFEFDVIKGAKNLLKRKKINVMIVEFNSTRINTNSNDISLISYLESLDYFTYKLNKDGLIRIKGFSYKTTQNFFVIKNDHKLMKRVNKTIKHLL